MKKLQQNDLTQEGDRKKGGKRRELKFHTGAEVHGTLGKAGCCLLMPKGSLESLLRAQVMDKVIFFPNGLVKERRYPILED